MSESDLTQTDEIFTVSSLDENINNYVSTEDSIQYHEIYPGVESIEYDYIAERKSFNSTNLVESTAYLIKACLGAGLLGIHEAYMHGGLWTSLVTNIVLGFIITYTTYMIVRAAHKMYVRIRLPKLSYPDLAEVVIATAPLKRLRRYSKTFRYTVDVLLFTEFCGSCCIFEIMIAETLKTVLEALSTYLAEKQFHVRIYILVISIPIALLCLIRNIRHLAKLSLAADLFLIICVATTVYLSLVEAGNLADRPAWKSVHGFLEFCGVCIYALDGVAMALPVENNMRRPQFFSYVLLYGSAIVLPCVILVGFFGYWRFGENCHTPVTFHLPKTTGSAIMQFLFTAMLTVTFAVHFWVPFRVVWRYVAKRHKRRRGLWERLYRLMHVFFVTVLAIAFPNLIKLMSFLGNFLLSFIVLIFPALFDTFVFWREQKTCMRIFSVIKNGVIATLGFILCIGSFYVAVV